MLQNIENTEDFEKFAQKYSECSRTARNGGDFGFIGRSDIDVFPKAFIEASFGLQVGEISNIVNTELGVHIIWWIEWLYITLFQHKIYLLSTFH